MKIFVPVIKLMNNFKYMQKFSIIGGILVIPMMIMAFMLLTEMNKDIKTIKERQGGAEYNARLKDFLQDVQQHRALSVNFTSGDASVKSEMEKKQEEVQKDILAMEELNQELGQSLKVSNAWDEIVEKWNKIEATIEESSPEEATNIHITFIEEILSLMVEVSDNSKLFLAETPHNYYLISGVTKTLPNLAEQLGQIRAIGMNVATEKQITEDQKMKLANLSSSVQSYLMDLEHEKETAFASEPTLEQSLGEASHNTIERTNTFLEFVQKEFLNSTEITVNADEYYKLTTNTIDTSFDLYNIETITLENSMSEQIKILQWNKTLIISGIVFIFILILYVFVGFYLSINESIRRLKIVSSSVSEGKLTTELILGTKDEMKDVETAFNKMIQNLRQLVNQINSSSEHLASSSAELSASAEQTRNVSEHITITVQEVTIGTEKQVEGVKESSSIVQEVTTSIHQVANNANTVSNTASIASQNAEDGEQAIQLAVKQMNSIKNTVSKAAQVIKELGKRSSEIGGILEVITGIAGQTNLLALNAAIEAARAGEHGQGFAVVADEVRKLAEQSEASAKQIGNLIISIQKETELAVQTMGSVTNEVIEGISAIDQAGSSFNRIQDSVQEVAREIEQVSSAVQQMSGGAEHIVKSMDVISLIAKESAEGTQNVSAATEEQLAAMEEIEASATTLSQLAEELRDTVGKFKI